MYGTVQACWEFGFRPDLSETWHIFQVKSWDFSLKRYKRNHILNQDVVLNTISNLQSCTSKLVRGNWIVRIFWDSWEYLSVRAKDSILLKQYQWKFYIIQCIVIRLRSSLPHVLGVSLAFGSGIFNWKILDHLYHFDKIFCTPLQWLVPSRASEC